MTRYEINGVFYSDELGRIEGLTVNEAFILTACTGLVFMDFERFKSKVDKHFSEKHSPFAFSHSSMFDKLKDEFEPQYKHMMKIDRVKAIHDAVLGADTDEQSF